MNAILQKGMAIGLMCSVSAIGLAAPTYAQDSSQNKLLERFEKLEAEMKLLRQQIAENKKQAVQTQKVAEAAVINVKKIEKSPEPVRSNIWHLAGYADVGVVFSDGENNDAFTSGKFNPSFHFQYKDLVLFESELQISTSNTGETDIELEYSQLDFLLHDNVVLVAGKFLSPVGQFQERLHPSWINKLTNAPVGFGHGGVQPISEVGMMLRGGIPVGDSTFTYALAVGNGPRSGHDGVEAEGFGRDDNGNKALSGRLGFLAFDNFELGGSFLTSKISPEAEAVPDVHGAEEEHGDEGPLGKYDLWGADFAYTKGNWDIRGEYLNAKLSGMPEHDDPDVIADPTKWKTWYVQAAYRLSGVSGSSFMRKLEPVVRYGQLKVEGEHELEEELNEKRFNVGLNYWMSPSVAFKSAVEFRSFGAHDRANDERIQFQLSYGF